jgi:hypothetical protein
LGLGANGLALPALFAFVLGHLRGLVWGIMFLKPLWGSENHRGKMSELPVNQRGLSMIYQWKSLAGDPIFAHFLLLLFG